MPSVECSLRPSHHADTVDTKQKANDSEAGDLMGVMSRKSGDNFIITSDRVDGEAPTKQASKKPLSDVFQVWTGEGWSASIGAAAIFSALDAAEDYIRANYGRVMG